MYLKFYGLTEAPFSLNPDPDFLYLGDKHQAAYSQMECGLLNQAPFSVLTGDVGMGKTVIIRRLINQIQSDENFTLGLMTNTQLTAKDLLRWILFTFNLDCPEEDEAKSHQIFYDFLIDEYAHNRQVVLIVDEAQNLDVETLERLRLLSNINVDKHQVLQTFLVGQEGLQEMLKKPELKQFAQRITYSFQLEPFSKLETHAYILHRLSVAGEEKRKIFSIGACDRVYHYSQGTPRLINVLCDAALVYGYSDELKLIGSDIIEEIVRDKRQGHILPISDLEFVPEEQISNDIEALYIEIDDSASNQIEAESNDNEKPIEANLFAEENKQEHLLEQQISDNQANVDEDESSSGIAGLPVPTYTENHVVNEQPGIHSFKLYGGLLLILVIGLFLWSSGSSDRDKSLELLVEKNIDKNTRSEINAGKVSANDVSEKVNNSDENSMMAVNIAIPEQSELSNIDREEISTSEIEFESQDITPAEIKLVKQFPASSGEIEKSEAPENKESVTLQLAIDPPSMKIDESTIPNKTPPVQIAKIDKIDKNSETSGPEGMIDTSIEKVKNFFQFLTPEVKTAPLQNEEKIRVVVRQGDTLINILIRETGEFKQATLNRVVYENPGILDANRIYTGQVIYISKQ